MSTPSVSNTQELLVYDAAACQRAFEAVRGKIGNYSNFLALLRARAHRVGGMPFKLHDLLKRFVNPNKPYFIGETSDGTKFLGDFRERHAVLTAVFPDHDSFLPKFVLQHVGAGQTFVDIGANIGTVAATVARALKNRGQVVAFEPLPYVMETAACTFALNELTNIHIARCAVSDVNDEIVFYSAPGHSEWSTTNPTEQAHLSWEQTRVPARTLDDLMDQGIVPQANFIKVDVEGHETKVFRGAQRLLSRHRPPVLYEYNFAAAAQAGWTIEEASVLLRGDGTGENEIRPYSFQVLQDGGQLEDISPAVLERGRQNPGHVDIFCHTPTASTKPNGML